MALTDNIVAYWKLDESSGNASDQVNGNTLTNNNSVAFSAGKINNGADFDSVANRTLSITDASQTGLDITGDFSYSGWFNIRATDPGAGGGHTYVHFSKHGAAAHRSYLLWYNADHGTYTFNFQTSVDGSAVVQRTVTDSGSGYNTANTWEHLVVTYSSGAGSNATKFYVNGSLYGTEAAAGTALFNSDETFYLGGGDANYLQGDGGASLDEVGMWSRVLTAGEVTSLYNSGTGLSYPFAASAAALPFRALMGAGV